MRATLRDIYTIKVLGVGGAGSKIINQMIRSGVKGFEFCAIDTDPQISSLSASMNILRITKSLNIYSHTDKTDRVSAEEDKARIRDHLKGSDLVFLIAGMGGDTGTGVTPVIAQIARELGVSTVAIVTKPLVTEEKHRILKAEKGIADLSMIADNVLIMSCDRVLRTAGNISVDEVFQLADHALTQIMLGISDLIALPNLVNIGLKKEIEPVLKGKGLYIGVGSGAGEKRAVKSAVRAVSNPFIEASLIGADDVLINITGGSSLSILEAEEAANIVYPLLDPKANFRLGSADDGSMEDNIRITVIASGSRNIESFRFKDRPDVSQV